MSPWFKSIFGSALGGGLSKSDISEPIILTLPGTRESNADAFKNKNGWKYKYLGADITLTEMQLTQGSAGSGANQGSIMPKKNGSNMLASALIPGNSNDDYVTGDLTGVPAANLQLTKGDFITLTDVEDAAADGADVAFILIATLR
jgi:hypothetical protein